MRRSVLLVDDHPGFRGEARRLLEGDGFDVIGEAADAATAMSEVTRLQPSVIVLDVGLPDASGLDIVGGLRDRSAGAIVVLVSGRQEAEYGGSVARSGADAFVEKARLSPGVMTDLLFGPGSR